MPKPATDLVRRSLLGALGAGAFWQTSARADAPPADRLAVGGTGSALGTMRRLVQAFRTENPALRIELPNSLGTSGGMRALVAGAIDVAVTTRPANDAEAAKGVGSIIYARSPYAFVTSRRGATSNVTRAELVEILALRRRTWSDGEPIRLVLRPQRDHDTEFLIHHIPEAGAALAATYARDIVPVAQTDQVNLDMAESLAGSFAAATLSAVRSEERKLGIIALDGVEPSNETLASGAYPLIRPFYLSTTPATTAAGRAFVEFVRSERARPILADCGKLQTLA